MAAAALHAVLQDGDLQVCHAIRDSVLVPKRTAKRLFRQSILEAWQNVCAYCGEAEAKTLDHVIPRHRGGLTSRRNLIAACERCNRRKGSSDWRQWFSLQECHCPERERRIEEWVNELGLEGISLG